MSAKFELEKSGSVSSDHHEALMAIVREAHSARQPGRVADPVPQRPNTGDRHLPGMQLTTDKDCGCTGDASGKSGPARPDWMEARERLRHTYEEKFRHGEPVKIEYGATVWDIAQARLSVEKGRKPSPQEIMKETSQILKELGCGPCDNPVGRTVAPPPRPGDSGHSAPERGSQHPPERGAQNPPERGTHNPPDGTGLPRESRPSQAGEIPGGCDNGQKSQHGRVERYGDVTIIREDNGATETIRTDRNGNPVEVTRQGGHWGNKPDHFRKTGEHEWSDDYGRKYHGDVHLDKDGTYSYTDGASGFTKVFKPDGSRYDQIADGRKTFIQTPDGPHQQSFVRTSDGKWVSHPGAEKFDTVSMSDNGTVRASNRDITKEMRPDGSQIDRGADGRPTYIRTADGANQKSFLRDHKTGKWHEIGRKEQYSDVHLNPDGSISARH